jgi:hypothetical protein
MNVDSHLAGRDRDRDPAEGVDDVVPERILLV